MNISYSAGFYRQLYCLTVHIPKRSKDIQRYLHSPTIMLCLLISTLIALCYAANNNSSGKTNSNMVSLFSLFLLLLLVLLLLLLLLLLNNSNQLITSKYSTLQTDYYTNLTYMNSVSYEDKKIVATNLMQLNY